MSTDILIKAYEKINAEMFFDEISIEDTKTFLIEHRSELDKVYDILEKCGVVDTYSKFELLKDFDLIEGFGGLYYIEDLKGNLIHINVSNFVYEITSMFTEPKRTIY